MKEDFNSAFGLVRIIYVPSPRYELKSKIRWIQSLLGNHQSGDIEILSSSIDFIYQFELMMVCCLQV